MADPIVLAVYIPPQAPAPGQPQQEEDAAEEGDLLEGVGQLPTDEQRHRPRDDEPGDSRPQVLLRDDLVVRGEDVLPPEARRLGVMNVRRYRPAH